MAEAQPNRIIADQRRSLSPETVRRGEERDRCATVLLGGSNPETTRIVRRVSRKHFAVLHRGPDQHFRHKEASARQLCSQRRKIPCWSAVVARSQSKRPHHWPGGAREGVAPSPQSLMTSSGPVRSGRFLNESMLEPSAASRAGLSGREAGWRLASNCPAVPAPLRSATATRGISTGP